jgi:hypothetical protein
MANLRQKYQMSFYNLQLTHHPFQIKIHFSTLVIIFRIIVDCIIFF